MRITANPGRSGSKPIECRPHWCTNAHIHGAAPRAKHVTIQKWRRRRVCFVHRQLPKLPIDILSSHAPVSHGTVYVCLTSTFTFERVGDNNLREIPRPPLRAKRVESICSSTVNKRSYVYQKLAENRCYTSLPGMLNSLRRLHKYRDRTVHGRI